MTTAALVMERVRTLLLPLFQAEGIELVDVEFRREGRGWVLRVYLDRPGGVTLDDCQRVSEQVGDLLDVEDLIDYPYTLEVSSPGLDRPLKTPEDFIRFTGRLVRLTTAAPIAGQRRFRGRLEGYREGQVILAQDHGPIFLIPYEAILKARLEVEL
jgi:ribosome maturation factor RimP